MLELVESLVKKFGAVCTIVLPTIGPQLQVHKDIGASSLIGFPAFNQFGWWCDERQGLSQEYKQQFLLACDESIKLNVIGSLNKIDPDLIWTQSIVAPWGARVSKYLNKPHIWYVTEFGERDFGFNFFTPFKEVIDEVQKSSNHVFTCSQILKDSLFPDANDQKVSVLYSHIKAPILNTKPSIFKYFQKKESVKLGMFSQVRHSKGQEDAVLALAECTRNGFNVELVIAGGADPDYLRHLINLAKENGVLELINFSGYEANPFELMDMCDIVIMSSRLEAFGRVGVEAMLLEKPVVFANTGGISEYQIDGKTGFSYAPGDTTDLALKLMHLVSDKTLRVNMGLSGKEHALKIFSEENFSGRVFEYAQKIIKLGRGNCKSPIIIENFLKKALADKAPLKDRRESVGRNDKCPCGSQIKYKRCCGSN
jgi:glycosyltransferase involved in cell wall biosynthesis